MFYKPVTPLTTDDLRERYPIRYRKPLKTPVQIIVGKNGITVRGYIAPHKSMLRPYATKEGKKDLSLRRRLELFDNEHSHDGDKASAPVYTFADAAIEGIMECWGKEYELEGLNFKVPVRVELIRKDGDPSLYDRHQRFFGIKMVRLSMTSFVSSSPWRWFWGFFKTGCPESMMINWSITSPGTIHLKEYYSLRSFKHVAAHEFGHVLGIGDAYDAHYRCFYEAPGTELFMMNRNASVDPQELEMVLRAHTTKRMQFFPFKISVKRFFKRVFRKD